MRYIYTLLLAVCGLGLSAQSIVIPTTKTPLITKRTASWCIHCGTWGWALYEGLLEDNSEQAALVAAHYSGDLKTDVAALWTSNLAAIGQPRFYIDNTDQGVNSSNINDKRSDIEQQVMDAALKSPLAQAGLIAASENDSLEIAAKVEFFEEVVGEFYLGVYLVQKEVLNVQTGQAGEVIHKNVLQAELTANWYGDLLINGTIPAGTTFDWNYTDKMLEGLKRENLRVLTVIWQKVDDKYEVINANMLPDIAEGVLVNANDLSILKEIRMLVYPNPLDSHTALEIDSPNSLHQVEISLWDIHGRKVRVLDRITQINGPYRLALEELSALAPGQYIIRLMSEELEQSVNLLKQ